MAAQSVGGDLGNLSPTVTSVDVDDATLDPTAGTTTSITVTAVVSDGNGYLDIPSSGGVTIGILAPGGAQHVAQASATRQSGSGNSATFTKTLTLNFYDAPGTYSVKVVTHDILNLVEVSDTSRTFAFSTLLASSAPASIDLGDSLNPGDVGTATALTITNTGNAAIDLQVSGTTLTHATESATIAVGAIAVSLASGMTSPTTMATTASDLSSFSLARGAASTKDLYFRLTVPSVAASPDGWLPAGAYTGTLTLTAVADA